MADSFIQRHFANLRHIRDVFRIDPRTGRGTSQIAPWISGVVRLVYPAFPGAFQFSSPEIRTGPTPAAGDDFQIIIPPQEIWRLRAVRLTLTTDATVANRHFLLAFNDSVNTFLEIPPSVVQTAGQIENYNWAYQLGYDVRQFPNRVSGLPGMFLQTGWSVGSRIINIQAGDQLSTPFLLVEVFPRS